MSTLSPGELTQAAARLRKLTAAAAAKKEKHTAPVDSSKLKFDSPLEPATNDETASEDHTAINDFNGTKSDYTGGSGRVIGGKYPQTL